MDKLLKFIIFSCFWVVIVPSYAQDINYVDLSQLQIQRRVKERVKFMYDYVSFMADKSKSQETRNYYCKKAL